MQDPGHINPIEDLANAAIQGLVAQRIAIVVQVMSSG
jgi:hypothetical protein